MFEFGRHKATFCILLVLWYGTYKLINNIWLWLCFIPISIVLVRTLRSWYLKEDIFAHDDTEFYVVDDLNNDEVMVHMCLPVWVQEFSTAHFLPALITQPHSCQPQVIYSENGIWKATIIHSKWHTIPGLILKNKFTIRYEQVN